MKKLVKILRLRSNCYNNNENYCESPILNKRMMFVRICFVHNNMIIINFRPSGERGSRNTRSRYLRSRYCCSVYPAVRNSYRALLRSSSIREPSDPPLRVIPKFFISQQPFQLFNNGNKQNFIEGWVRWILFPNLYCFSLVNRAIDCLIVNGRATRTLHVSPIARWQSQLLDRY